MPKTSGYRGIWERIPTFSVHMTENVGIAVREGQSSDVLGTDDLIARLAGHQYGLVTRRQQRAAGITADTIDGRVKNKGPTPPAIRPCRTSPGSRRPC